MNFGELGTTFEPAPEGPSTAVLVSFIDRGQQQSKFGASRQAGVRLELVDVKTESGEPCLVFCTFFNLSLKSKNFREMVTALLGPGDLRGTPLKKMLGAACKVTIVHKETEDGTVYANVAAYKALKPGTDVTEPASDLVFFSLDPLEVGGLKALETMFAALPEGEQTKVAASETYKELISTLRHTKASAGKRAGAIVKDAIPGEPPFDDSFPDDLGGAAA